MPGLFRTVVILLGAANADKKLAITQNGVDDLISAVGTFGLKIMSVDSNSQEILRRLETIQAGMESLQLQLTTLQSEKHAEKLAQNATDEKNGEVKPLTDKDIAQRKKIFEDLKLVDSFNHTSVAAREVNGTGWYASKHRGITIISKKGNTTTSAPKFCHVYEPASAFGAGAEDLRNMTSPFEKIWPINWKYYEKRQQIDSMSPCTKSRYVAVIETDSDSMDGMWNPNIFEGMSSTTTGEECDDRKVSGGMIIYACKILRPEKIIMDAEEKLTSLIESHAEALKTLQKESKKIEDKQADQTEKMEKRIVVLEKRLKKKSKKIKKLKKKKGNKDSGCEQVGPDLFPNSV